MPLRKKQLMFRGLKIYYKSKCFEFLAVALSAILNDNGIKNIILTKLPKNDTKNLYIFLGLNSHANGNLPKYYIAYQLEQYSNSKWFSDEYIRRLNSAVEIWDYSKRNIDYLKTVNVTAPVRYVPLGYHRSMKFKKEQHSNPQYDCLFYGSHRARRQQVIDNLTAENIKVEFINQYNGYQYQNELEPHINNSRIVLNIHIDDVSKSILEQTRIIPLIYNRRIVVSEHSSEPEVDARFEPYIVFSTDIVRTCKDILTGKIEITPNYKQFLQDFEYAKNVPVEYLRELLLRGRGNAVPPP